MCIRDRSLEGMVGSESPEEGMVEKVALHTAINRLPERERKLIFLQMCIRDSDWCISRQLWWGHQIPVWYCDDCGHMTASRTAPTVCAQCGSCLLYTSLMVQKASFRLTFPIRMDLTSVPANSMPASYLSSTK